MVPHWPASMGMRELTRLSKGKTVGDYRASIEWNRAGEDFADNRYSRGHFWRFDGGIDVPASSSPQVIPLPMSVEAAVDPEEAFVASLASCHMLWFLALAQKQGWVVDHYRDGAVGTLAMNAGRKMAMTQVTLRPRVSFAGSSPPDDATVIALHHRAHEQCYIANSVTTQIVCEPLDSDGGPLGASIGVKL